MKLFYSERILIDILEQQIFPVAKSVLGPYHAPQPVYGTMAASNTKKALATCILDLDAEGILVVQLDNFNAEKATGYQYINFTNIQAVHVEKGFLCEKLSLLLNNGDYFTFQIKSNSSKRLPNQAEYAKHLFAILEGKQATTPTR